VELTAVNIVVIVLLLLSTALHEMAHAYTAYWLGDPTPGRHGRLTFNPLAHLQPVYTAIVFPIILYFMNGTLFMLAQTPIDPSRFRKPLRDHALVAVAGPLANIAVAGLFLGILWIPGAIKPHTIAGDALPQAIFWNLLLAAFNLLPLPPLDGYWIARGLLPLRIRMHTDAFALSGAAMIVVMLVGSWIVRKFIIKIMLFVIHMLPLEFVYALFL
jgi:Zn-dependent protease